MNRTLLPFRRRGGQPLLEEVAVTESRLIERIDEAGQRAEEATARLGEELDTFFRIDDTRLKKTGKAFSDFRERLERIEKILDAGTVATVDGMGRDLALAAQRRRRSVVEVRQPLVLISQIQRSGGTLLSQLFDCHPQCHAHPYELDFGYPGPKIWPAISPHGAPDELWEAVWEARAETHFQLGYHKSKRKEVFPFLLVPTLARQLFEDVLRSRAVESARDVLDAYMTAYFNAWLDNQNLYGEDKRWVVAFSPGLAVEAEHRERFFADYPDGRLLCVVRDPKGWYASALGYHERYADLERSIEVWRASTQAALAAKRDYGDQVLLIRFEQLVRDTRETMEAITSFLGIDLPEIALVPTFNGSPISAASSFDVEEHGVLQAPAERGSSLEPATAAKVDALAGDDYQAALKLVL
jgi:hypothetical protein